MIQRRVMSNWFVELHLFGDVGSTNPMPLIYGYAQPVEREARPWHAEQLPGCKQVVVVRATLTLPEFSLFEQAIDGTGVHPLSINSPKKRSLSMVLPGFWLRPPVLLRGLEGQPYAHSPLGVPSKCVERWNLDKKTLLDTLAMGTSNLLERNTRIAEILRAVGEETGIGLVGAAMPRLGNFDRIEPTFAGREYACTWRPIKQRPALASSNGIQVELAQSLADGSQNLILGVELRNGDVAVVHKVHRWTPGDGKYLNIYAAEPVSSAHVTVFDEASGDLLGEKDAMVLRSIGCTMMAVGGTIIVNDPWMRKLRQKTPGSKDPILQSVGSVLPVSHTTEMLVGGEEDTDPWVDAGLQTRQTQAVLAGKQQGLFLPRENAIQEAAAFQNIRRLFDQPGTQHVTLIDPYFNADGRKLLLRIVHPFRFRILTSLKAEAWDALREQLRRDSDFLHPQLEIYQAKDRPGEQSFHDRYLVVDGQQGRTTYTLTNSFAALGAKHPIVVVPLEGELALRVEDYVDGLLAEAGQPWWPDPATSTSSTSVKPVDERVVLGGQLLSGVLGDPLANPEGLVLRLGQAKVWEMLAAWLGQPARDVLSARYLLNFLAGHVPGGTDVSVAVGMLSQYNPGACARTLERCLTEELASIRAREESPWMHRSNLYALAEIVRRWACDGDARLLAFEEVLQLTGIGPLYDHRYGARLALQLLLRLKPDSVLRIADSLFVEAKTRAVAQQTEGAATNVADEPAYLRAGSLLWYLANVGDADTLQVFEESAILILRQLFAATLGNQAHGIPEAVAMSSRMQAANWSVEERVAALFGMAKARRQIEKSTRPVCLEAIAAILPPNFSPLLERVLFEKSDRIGRQALSVLADSTRVKQPTAAAHIRERLIVNFEGLLVTSDTPDSPYLGQDELAHLEYAVRAILERPVPEVLAYLDNMLKQFSRTTARLEHPRSTTVHYTEWRKRMAIGSLLLCYILRIAEEILSVARLKTIDLVKSAKVKSDRAFSGFFEMYSWHAHSPLPEALRTVWRRWMNHAPITFASEI